MNKVVKATVSLLVITAVGYSQSTFVVTGTQIPAELIRANFGRLPKNIGATDLNICNVTSNRQSLVSSQVYQALAASQPGMQPLGRDIILSTILKSRAHNASGMLAIALNIAAGVFSVLSSSKQVLPSQWCAWLAVAALVSQQLLTSLHPVIPSDQMAAFDRQVLESAIVVEGGSCAERTVFVVAEPHQVGARNFKFHIQ